MARKPLNLLRFLTRAPCLDSNIPNYRRARRRALWPGVATPPLGATWTKKRKKTGDVVVVVVVGGGGGGGGAAAAAVFLAAAAVGWCGGSP